MPDNAVWIKTEIDNKDAQKELLKLQKEIAKTEETIDGLKKSAADNQQKTVFSAAELDAEKKKLEDMRRTLEEMRSVSKDKSYGASVRAEAASQIPVMKTETAEQAQRVRELQKEYNRLESKAKKYEETLRKAEEKLSKQQERAGALTEQLTSARGVLGRFPRDIENANKRMEKLRRRVRELVKSALLFSVITKGLTELREWAASVIMANDEARQAIGRLKGALLTLAQPLVEVLVPAFVYMANVLADIVNLLAQASAKIFGKTGEEAAKSAEALYDEQAALKGVGDAAKKAEKSLASFDEINQLRSSGTSIGQTIEPVFGTGTGPTPSGEELPGILAAVAAIGTALLAWKLPGGFLGNLQTCLGLALSIGGAIGLAKGSTDAWANGLSWDNLTQMLIGLTALAVGLGVAFGAPAAGIATIAGGLALLAIGFKDVDENGMTAQNRLAILAGLLSTGLGIGLLTGSYIPLLAAGILGIGFLFAASGGEGEKWVAGMKGAFLGLLDFLKGTFTGDLDLALDGISELFDGLGTSAEATLDGTKNSFLSFLDWLDEKTDGRFSGVIDTTKDLASRAIDDIKKDITEVFLPSLKNEFAGFTKTVSGIFTSDWDLAWEGFKQSALGAIGKILSFKFGGRGVDWLDRLLEKLGLAEKRGTFDKLYAFDNPRASERAATFRVQALASGAVIPPNRAFLAVLGDQHSGTNVEAPLSTIEQAVENVLARRGGAGGGEMTLNISALPGFARYLKFELDAESTRQGGRLVNIERVYT